MAIHHYTDEALFTSTINHRLSPSSPIREANLLKGRQNQLRQISRALSTPGTQAFIFGERGVGKTSLAQTAAFDFQTNAIDPIILGCDKTSSVTSIIHACVERLLDQSPTYRSSSVSAELAAKYRYLGANISKQIVSGRVEEPKSLNDAIGLLRFCSETIDSSIVVVVDELDRIEDKNKYLFGDLIKQLADQSIGVKFIFCGVGTSLEALLDDHESAYRYLANVMLTPLDWESRLEIINSTSHVFNIDIDNSYKYNFGFISDGFPHYIHLLMSKLLWAIFDDPAIIDHASVDHYRSAIEDSVADVEQHLKSSYERATKKYTDAYVEILWACADHYEFSQKSSDIYDRYLTIMRRLDKKPLTRERFNAHINRLKNESHDEILLGTRAGWYSFKEPLIRGYIRLEAARKGIVLGASHPFERSTKSDYSFQSKPPRG